MTWGALEQSNSSLAAFGLARLNGKVAYVATVRKDGSPRVHPVTPIIGQGHLFIFMEPTSPKGGDLRRGSSYALHCAVSDNSGESGEFIVTGHGQLVEDPATRALAAQLSTYKPADRYILFELSVETASATAYENDQPVRQHWQK